MNIPHLILKTSSADVGRDGPGGGRETCLRVSGYGQSGDYIVIGRGDLYPDLIRGDEGRFDEERERIEAALFVALHAHNTSPHEGGVWTSGWNRLIDSIREAKEWDANITIPY